ncbi:MAG TPA: sugar phosphate isomerase/epimerase family protein [Verrucomicrobiota bacterium]|nr:sugar phosphate isomerase/epimerase family protein [Verrucomicrobiota bacterium]HNU53058.1 sugar phosphate isomerase/epimerase family protein [Verrucomicrobiota bacterium]
MNRRDFLSTTTAAAGALAVCGAPTILAAEETWPLKGRIYKSLKIGMVKVPGSLTEKLQALKELGYRGVEMDSPGMDVEATRQAVAASGLAVDGTVCSTHWGIRHSDKNPETRAKALADLKTALRDTKAVGGHTVLLVVGSGDDGTEAEVWERSVANIRQALPLAAELGVVIAVENVWNKFLYAHDGPADQTAEKLAKYVDEFKSPWLGVQFDLGNHQKYGSPAAWVRTLGRRIVKLDVKDWGRKAGWAKIGEGDVDWPEVRRALHDIGYIGYAAAEVGGGDRDVLREVSQQMDRVFGLV